MEKNIKDLVLDELILRYSGIQVSMLTTQLDIVQFKGEVYRWSLGGI